jgi:outer membrane beta-barrel protein
MIKTRIGLLVAAALSGLTAAAIAQAAAEKAPAAGAQGAASAEGVIDADGAASASAEASAGAEGAATDTAAGGEAEGDEALGDIEGGPEEGGLKQICDIDPDACPKLVMSEEAKKPLNAHMYAVQQIYALRRLRFELNPYWAFTLNDQFVDHTAPGLALNFYIFNVLAVGVNGNYYAPFNTDKAFNADVRRAARVGVPINEYNWSGAFNITYVPAYGKFAGFQDFIFHWDAYVTLGGGMISTRPIPVFDPDFRNYKYEAKPAGNAGLGLRVFFNRWFTAILELRDYIYQERLENQADTTTMSDEMRANPDNWFDPTKRLTNHVQLQAGVSIFLPFSFEYRLPK